MLLLSGGWDIYLIGVGREICGWYMLNVDMWVYINCNLEMDGVGCYIVVLQFVQFVIILKCKEIIYFLINGCECRGMYKYKFKVYVL